MKHMIKLIATTVSKVKHSMIVLRYKYLIVVYSNKGASKDML